MTQRLLIVLLVGLSFAGSASAQYSSDFEGLIADPNGVILTGQDAYYLPAGSTDFKAYTYTNNVLTVPMNPEGGSQFIAGTAAGNAVYARAQRDFSTYQWTWRFEYDFCGLYTLAPPASNNIGSFSLRVDSTNNNYINLMWFIDPNNPTSFNMSYIAFDAAGTMFTSPGLTPGPEWENLSLATWYHVFTECDFNTNRIMRVGLRNIQTNQEWVATPADWYMVGGAGGWPVTPIAFRFFAGGTTGGNTSAWDNTRLEPMFPGACCLPDGTCIFVEETVCLDAGGEWLGPESVCDPNPCAVGGACCFADGSCQVLSEAACLGQGGDWLGPDYVCDPNPCEPTAIEPSTWGRIKASFR